MADAMHGDISELTKVRAKAEMGIRTTLDAMVGAGLSEVLDPLTLADQAALNAEALRTRDAKAGWPGTLRRSRKLHHLGELAAYLGIELKLIEPYAGPRYWTVESAARSMAVQERLDETAADALLKKMMAAAAAGELEVLDPHRIQPCRADPSRDWYYLTTLSRVNEWLAKVGADYRWGAPLDHPISKSLDHWFTSRIEKLPESIRVTLLVVLHESMLDWDLLDEVQRRSWAKTYDAAHGTAAEAAEHVGWCDATLDADHWFSLNDVEPGLAAMLLCQYNPNTETLEQAKQCTNDVTRPQDFLRLLQRFEDLAKCKPQHRTLLDWLHFARGASLRYHPWIDEYAKAKGLDVAAAESRKRPATLPGAPIEGHHEGGVMLDVKTAPIDWAAYRFRDGFTLFEVACLLHHLDPRAVFDDAHHALRKHGEGAADVLNSPAAAAEMLHLNPGAFFMPPVGDTLERLKRAAGSRLGLSINAARARALAAMLELPYPPELEREAPAPTARAAGLEHAITARHSKDASDEALFARHFDIAAHRLKLQADRAALLAQTPQTIIEHKTKREELEFIDGALRALDEEPAPSNAGTPTATGPVPAVLVADDAPIPLSTRNIALCFAGLRRWEEPRWKKALGDKPKWLAACITTPGQQGVRETQWDPVCIGAALVKAGNAPARSVRAKFQSQPLLQPWREAWKTYEADYIDSD